MEARAGEHEAALLRFDSLRERYPDSPACLEGCVIAGDILYRLGRYEEAGRRYEAAMAMHDAPPADLLYHSALALEKNEDPAGALERVQILLARHPEDERVPEAMMKVGHLLQTLGQHDRAILAYRNAEIFQDREGRARLQFWIADCLESAGDPEGALSAFLKVGYLFGDQGLWAVTAMLRAASLCEEAGQLSQARQLYARVIADQGEDSDFARTAREALARLDGGREPD
jgi:tetratricopeptide (TPR) repeat protein